MVNDMVVGPGKFESTADMSKPGAPMSHPVDLRRAIDLWVSGEWSLLAIKDEALIAPDRDNALTAAYIASAHHFCDDHEGGRAWAERALSLGCPKDYLARVLSAGVHITLARMAAVAGYAERARAHITRSAAPIPGEQSHAKAQARLSTELAALGLFHASAQVLSDDLDSMLEEPLGRTTRLRISTFQSELRILRYQLAHYQSRELAAVGSDVLRPENADAHLAASRSVSQLGQDLWVLERTGYKRGGFFVEFGATDGVLLSNTLLLETLFGWSGLLAEPNPVYFAALKENRSSKLSEACIAGKSGEIVDFVLADEFGGIKNFFASDQHATRRTPYAALPENVLQLETVSLDSFLEQNDAPRRIDYISVDTEGSELDILRAFPFEKWDVSMWTVEHNFTEAREEIFQIMTSNGYRRKKVRFDDWYYKPDAGR